MGRSQCFIEFFSLIFLRYNVHFIEWMIVYKFGYTCEFVRVFASACAKVLRMYIRVRVDALLNGCVDDSVGVLACLCVLVSMSA